MTPRSSETELPSITWMTAPGPKVRTGRRLILVLRVSQRKGRTGSSFMAPDQQRDWCYPYAAQHGDEIIAEVDETDSVSGGTVDRNGLQWALKQCLKGEADGVIVADVKRFSRNKIGGWLVVQKLLDEQLSFIAAKDRVDSAGKGKLDRPTEAYLDSALREAQWEREDLKERWDDVTRRHIADGRAVLPSYGYRKNSKTGRLVKHGPEAKWVQWIFAKRGAGWRWIRIVDELNKRKVPPPRPHSKKVPPAKVWVHQHITQIINNRTYLGELHRGAHVNPTAHAAIVTLPAWDAAHAVRVGHGQGDHPALVYLLRGLVRCASCGSRMTPFSDLKADGERVRYYRCKPRQSWGRCPRPALVRADELEAEAIAFFEQRALGSFRASSRRVNQRLDAAIAATAQAEAELAAYARTTQASGDEFEAVFAEGLAERQNAVRAARATETEARSVAIGVELPADLAEAWARHDDDQRSALLGRLIYCIAVRPARVARQPDPAAGRIKIFVVGDPSCPTGLPGRPIGRRPKGAPPWKSAKRPITW